MRGIRSVLVMLFLGAASVVEPASAAEPPLAAGIRRFYDLAVEWNVGKDNGRLTVTGSLKNIRVFQLRDIELRVLLKGEGGEEIGRATFMFLPLLVPPGTTLPYGLAITVPPTRNPARLELLYVYRMAEGVEENIPQFQGVTVELDRQKE